MSAIIDENDPRKEIINAYTKDMPAENVAVENDKRPEVNRFGFILDEGTFTPLSKDILEKERVSQAKWLKLLQKWDKVFPSSKLRKLLFKGLPNSIRGEVWKRVLDVPKIISVNENEYDNMKYLALQVSNDIRQIDLDINRTYRDHIMFSERYGRKQRSLFTVLSAYTVHNSEVGYCQGMSSVAALLLMYLNEEDAFWALSNLLTGQKHSMHGFFVEGFPKLMRFQAHHEKIFRKMLPKLAAHFERQGVMSSLYTLKWYMQCFLDRLPFYLILRLWDVFVHDGDKILHPIGYTILKMHRKQLINMQLDELATFLSSGMSSIKYDADVFMEQLADNIDELKKHNLYPAPSAVEGELPSDAGFAAKIVIDTTPMFKSGSSVKVDQVAEASGKGTAETEKEHVLDKKPPAGNYASMNTRFRGLPPGIPHPPAYRAPSPETLDDKLFFKKNASAAIIDIPTSKRKDSAILEKKAPSTVIMSTKSSKLSPKDTTNQNSNPAGSVKSKDKGGNIVRHVSEIKFETVKSEEI